MTLLFIAILASLSCIIAYKLHFFDLDWSLPGKNPVRFWHLILGTVIYIGISFLIPIILFIFFRPGRASNTFFTGSSFLVAIAVSLLALWGFIHMMKKEVRTKIFGPSTSTLQNWRSFGLGALSYLVAFPTAALLSTIVNLFTQVIWPNYEPRDQTAIQHLKMLSEYPIILALTVVCFTIIVPMIEEFLFRGLLQSWLKNHLSRLWSVLVTAVIFGFFHFSKIQGLANIDLIITLSLLGFFLGFVYEKRGSLWAPIGLHVTFNSISVVRILLEVFHIV